MKATIKAVIFDMDGVVVESGALQRNVINEIGSKFGFSISEEEWVNDYVGTGTQSILSRLFQKYGVDEDVDLWIEKRKKMYIQIIDENGISVVEGLKTFIELLEERGIRFIIASNGHKEVIGNVLERIGLGGRMEFLGTEDVENPKPAPDLYLLAARKLETPPEECVVFEDTIVGITAAKSAGMKCVAVLTSVGRTEEGRQKLADTGADAFIENFSGLTFEKLEEML